MGRVTKSVLPEQLRLRKQDFAGRRAKRRQGPVQEGGGVQIRHDAPHVGPANGFDPASVRRVWHGPRFRGCRRRQRQKVESKARRLYWTGQLH